jgi:hypothetical protein
MGADFILVDRQTERPKPAAGKNHFVTAYIRIFAHKIKTVPTQMMLAILKA